MRISTNSYYVESLEVCFDREVNMAKQTLALIFFKCTATARASKTVKSFVYPKNWNFDCFKRKVNKYEMSSCRSETNIKLDVSLIYSIYPDIMWEWTHISFAFLICRCSIDVLCSVYCFGSDLLTNPLYFNEYSFVYK